MRAHRFVVGVVWIFLACASAASAHALLVASSPAPGTRVERAPQRVSLTFDDPVTLPPQALRVLDTRGIDETLGPAFQPRGDGRIVAVRTAALARGQYNVIWHVVSDDGHIEGGVFAFGVRESAGAVSDAVVAQDVPGATALRAVLHFFLLAGIVIGVGLFAASELVARRGETIAPSVLGFAAWCVIAFVAFMEIFVQANLAGFSFGAVLTTRYGISRIVLIGAAIAGFRAFLVPRGQRALLAGASCAAILAEVFSGHAATGTLPVLGVVADAVHLLGATTWIGVLLVTLLAAERIDVRRTSNVALICVLAIVASAVPQALRGIGSFAALTGSTYGLLVCAKIALLLVALAFAARSRRHAPQGAAAITGSVRSEVAVLTVVLAVTALLVEVAPPR
jgi:copper transport protein